MKYRLGIVKENEETGLLPECSFCKTRTEQILIEETAILEGNEIPAKYAICPDCMDKKLQFIPSSD